MFIWLSFCDIHAPEGSQFLGVAIIEVESAASEAEAIKAAVMKAHREGCNPGGEVGAIAVPGEHEGKVRGLTNRLMQKDELKRAGFI
jgi:hypothetical protein